MYEIVLEKHSMSLHTPDEAPENDSCYECIRIRQAAATNYQINSNESRNRIIINFEEIYTAYIDMQSLVLLDSSRHDSSANLFLVLSLIN